MSDFHNQKIIPSLSKDNEIHQFISSVMDYCILIHLDLKDLKKYIDLIHQHNKFCFIHLDYINGIAIDKHGCEYVLNQLQADGILSSNNEVILTAKKYKKVAIQRLFLVDSATLEKELIQINLNNPDYVELIPGIAHEIFPTVKLHLKCNLIAGGLLKTTEQLYACLNSGASAVTVSSLALVDSFYKSYLD